MSEWHEKFRKEIEYCTYCPKLCRFSCPVAQIECSETMTPTGKMTVLKLVKDGLLPFDEEAAELVYMCSGCLITRTYCEHDILVYPSFEAARIEAVKKGVAPKTALEYEKQWSRHGNPFLVHMPEILKNQVPEKRLQNSAATVLFTGCTATHYFPDQIGDTRRLMEAMNVDFSVFNRDWICCGYPLLTMGHREPFEKQAGAVSKALGNAELIISPCPTCPHMLKERYPEFGLGLKARVIHITEFLAENIERIPIKSKDNRRAIYHDPCHLGRYLGVYEEPRQLLEAALGSPPIEFFENREQATCCGGGGGLPVSKPKTARRIAREKAEAVEEYGADLLATACPMCRRMLGRSGKDLNISVDDVVSIISKLL